MRSSSKKEAQNSYFISEFQKPSSSHVRDVVKTKSVIQSHVKEQGYIRIIRAVLMKEHFYHLSQTFKVYYICMSKPSLQDF